MQEMSKQQKAVFGFIEKYHIENGLSPSLSDIAIGLDLGQSTIVGHVNALKRKGYLSSRERIPRSFVITEKQNAGNQA